MNLQGDRTICKCATAKEAQEGDVPEERDECDECENNTSDDDTDPSSRRDFDLRVFQEVRSCIDG